jgi:hypothetical protein
MQSTTLPDLTLLLCRADALLRRVRRERPDTAGLVRQLRRGLGRLALALDEDGGPEAVVVRDEDAQPSFDGE